MTYMENALKGEGEIQKDSSHLSPFTEKVIL